MANKNMRTVKIYGMSGYKYQATPTIMLKGKWLEELGFEIGDYITVSCEDGRLIITGTEFNESGNNYSKGSIEIDGHPCTWSIHAIPLSDMYSISGLPEDACYVGIRITVQ